VDGYVSIAHHPSRVVWYKGSIGDLSGITDIQITDKSGVVILYGELNLNSGTPYMMDGDVIFFVLKST